MIAQQQTATSRQSATWRAHAVALYQARTVRFGWHRLPAGIRPGVELFVVLSGDETPRQTYAGPRHMATREHLVRYSAETGQVYCDCTASVYQRPCAHCGQVLSIKQSDAKAMSQQGEW